MPRKTLIRSSVLPYHITARSNNRVPFAGDLRDRWRILGNQLAEAEETHGLCIHAFVLMPNHLHLLASTPKSDVGICMRDFLRSSTKINNKKLGHSGRIFGARYHWSLVDHDQYLDSVVKYIYRNPVKAGLCASVEDYPFSTLKSSLDAEATPFTLTPVIGHSLIPGGWDCFLDWLNTPFRNEEDLAIAKGLKKTRFMPPLHGPKRLPFPLPAFVRKKKV